MNLWVEYDILANANNAARKPSNVVYSGQRHDLTSLSTIIIIIISMFIEDNVFSTTVSLPYGPLVNTDIGYFGPFCYYSDFFILDMRC